ncbi:hypothetical protein L218DRAFT_818892, partial [Marasmius fiardii PR-910]
KYSRPSEQFVTAGKIPKKEHVYTIARYTSDLAKEFFLNKVAQNHEKWSLNKYFRGLFNYCFPIDFHSQQHERIKRCYQNEQRVAKYVNELKTLFKLVRTYSKRDRIIELWEGFDPQMRWEL